ncbi:Acetyl-CoA acetyltransferase [Tardiphaga sp. OK246]|uniref:thiolase family protein n=1 Tax=Tardiphaga sp. OK246 TaxID=1855307 RepID=UPI000B75F34D|nr:thiolase family protein [Tardiphaga sp. OK246]SNT32618.1 Acetyl-CoA acetyltransferase [Tardiphaga sp. OK246]
MSDIYIVGVGMTPFGKMPESSVKALTNQAVSQALTDANASRQDLSSAFFSNTSQSPLESQYMIGGEIALREMGITGIPVVNVENACASASTAFHLAYAHLKAGLSDVALAVGAEKMTHPDKVRSMSVFDGAWDVHTVVETSQRLAKMGEGVFPPPGRPTSSGPYSVFMDVYAAFAKFHMRTFGTTERQIAAAAAKNHFHSTFNPLSQYRFDMSVDEVLAARMIAWPLTLPMCAPISDGAAAAILVREEALDRFDRTRAVKVCASVMGTGTNRQPEQYDKHMCRIAALKAYEQASIGPEDISVAEVHDASSFGEILQVENLGFCDFGEGGRLAENGDTKLGGRIPVNPSGGLVSKGHPIGATGLAQIYELTVQLRHEAGNRQVTDARFAIAENGGGLYGYEEAVACITILGR